MLFLRWYNFNNEPTTYVLKPHRSGSKTDAQNGGSRKRCVQTASSRRQRRRLIQAMPEVRSPQRRPSFPSCHRRFRRRSWQRSDKPSCSRRHRPNRPEVRRIGVARASLFCARKRGNTCRTWASWASSWRVVRVAVTSLMTKGNQKWPMSKAKRMHFAIYFKKKLNWKW